MKNDYEIYGKQSFPSNVLELSNENLRYLNFYQN